MWTEIQFRELSKTKQECQHRSVRQYKVIQCFAAVCYWSGCSTDRTLLGIRNHRVLGLVLLNQACTWDRKPNVTVEWWALLLRIREISGSNLGPETSYPDRFFVVFLRHSRQMPFQYRANAMRWVIHSVLSELTLPDCAEFKIYFCSLLHLYAIELRNFVQFWFYSVS
jgi:hypothetical protein